MASKGKGESSAHRRLKRAALEWAQIQGYSICGLEVRVPNSNYRADVAAYRPAKLARRGPASPGETVIFECKQARPDFLNNSRPVQETLARLETCRARLAKLERLLGSHHPHLGRGDSLFAEFETFDLAELDHSGYQKLLKEIRTLESRLYGKTKFDRMIRWSCANAFYLVVEDGIMKECETPLAWGLLKCADDGALELIRRPVFQDVPEVRRLELLHRLGSAGTRMFNRSQEIDAGMVFEARRRNLDRAPDAENGADEHEEAAED